MEFLKIFFPPLCVLLVPMIAGWIAYKNYRKQKRRDDILQSFAVLMGIKLPYIQAVQFQASCYILSEFYDVKYHKITRDIEDQKESKAKYERGTDAISTISELNKELFSTLGVLLTCFEKDDAIKNLVIDFYHNHQAVVVPNFPIDLITNEHDLNSVKDEHFRVMENLVNSRYDQKIKNLINALEERIDNLYNE